MRHTLHTAALVALASCPAAFAQLRVVTWNVTNYSTTVPSARDNAFKTAIYGVVPNGLPLQGQSMSPDVFVGQEFLNQTAVTNFVNLLNTAPGSPGDWAAAPFLDGADTDNAFFYRTSKVEFLGVTIIAVGSSSTANQPRDTHRYDIRPTGYAAPAASMGIYSTHMKAQGGTNSSGRRFVEAQRIRDNAEGIDTNGPGSALPAGYRFMVAGDFNGQSSGESFYVEFTSSQANNAGRFFDPISTPGSWNNNPAFAMIHTQDPAVQVDDRHDQILVGSALVDGSGLDYIGAFGTPWNLTTFIDPNHSYRCWGNDGTSFDAVLRTVNNQMVGQTIAEAVVISASGQGHLPVLLDLRLPPEAGAPVLVDFGTVALNATAQINVPIGNSALDNVFGAGGIEQLSYTLAASPGFTLPGGPGPFNDAAGGTLNSHTLVMNTSTPGPVSGTLTISSNSPDDPALVVQLVGTVTPPATCDGDVNGDLLVNTADLALLLGFFGTNVPPNTSGDLDGNGAVNTADLAFLLGNFGRSCL
ncbi:MAG: hypothetical protein ACKVZJ_10015 [Phycisphaerales bacterium]